MTIQSTAGGVPPLPQSSTPKSDTLKDAASRVSKATGGPLTQAPPTASFPTTAVAATPPLTPDLEKAVAAVKQSLKKEMNLQTLLNMAPPVREIVLKDLTDKDQNAFEVALGKGTSVQDSYKSEFQKLKSQINQFKQNRLLQEILADHPTWKSQVEAWKGVSLEDKIWLLQLYELRNLGVNIPQIVKQKDSVIPSQSTPDLLKPDAKAAIATALNAVTELDWSHRQLKKCPQAICLLDNLEVLYLNYNKLTAAPDVSKNVHLINLYLGENPLTAPPNVSRNINLKELYLNYTQLTIPPDVSKNVKLTILVLSGNQLTTAPDVSKNVKLEVLHLHQNQLNSGAKQAEKLKNEHINLCIEY